MAVSSQDILNFLLANPNMSDRDIAAAMDMYGVTPAMMAQAVGIPVQQVQQRYENVQPQGLLAPPEPIKTPEPVYTPESVYTPPEPVYIPEPVYEQPTNVSSEPQQTQEATTMAVTSQQIIDFLLANPNMSDAQIVSAMEQYGVSPAQMAQAVGLPEGEVAARAAATVPQGQTITLGDTVVQPVYQVTGSGMDQQVGGLENVITYKATDNKAGGAFTQYTPTGEVEQTGTQQEVKSGLKEFAIGTGLLLGLPTILNAGAGGASAFELANAGASAMTDLGAFELANAGASALTDLGAFELANAGASALTDLGAFELANAGASALTDLGAFELANAGAGALTPTFVPPVTTPGLLTPPVVTPPVVTPPVVTPPAVTPPAVTPPVVAPPVVAPPVVAPPVIAPPTVADITKLAQAGLTAAQIAALLSTGTQTAAGLLQQQTSREAAQKAQAMIDAETAAAKTSAAFRPIGMTTRFGASQFGFDPKTGQLTSAGYTLSPEAKAAQDRFVKLAEQGIQQAEGAQKAFEPLQTGAQSLFTLGNKYLAQTPESVAENYLKSQMALLQPGRELQLANLQNRLQQQGRGGLSVAQGGTLGATTPELQALFNARAQQEAQLAANAQREGQQNVLFGSGLLSQGAQTMGQYYGGQQAAYSPYTTALGQVTGLESAAQQPFQLGVGLGKEASLAGARVGQLGLQGAGQSVALATGPAATTNPYATILSGLAANPLFGQGAASLFTPSNEAAVINPYFQTYS